MADNITVEDVRHYLLDNSPEDNDLLVDLAFSDTEIKQAMQRAARDYNSVPPRVNNADPDCLDATTNMFLDGIAKHLYIAELSRSTRNDLDYTAGGVTTNIEQKRIEHLKTLIKMHGDFFLEAAHNTKLLINIEDAFGQVG